MGLLKLGDSPLILAGGGGNVQLSKQVEITTNGTTTVSPDSGYDGIAQVDVVTNVTGNTTEITNVAVSPDVELSVGNAKILYQTANNKWLMQSVYNFGSDDFTLNNVLIGGFIVFFVAITNKLHWRILDANNIEAVEVTEAEVVEPLNTLLPCCIVRVTGTNASVILNVPQ